MFVAMAPILVPLAIWIYTLVFAFSSLWFSHFTLMALEQLRKQKVLVAESLRAQPAIELIANERRTEEFNKEIKEIKEV